jgi:hypothetical protein
MWSWAGCGLRAAILTTLPYIMGLCKYVSAFSVGLGRDADHSPPSSAEVKTE